MSFCPKISREEEVCAAALVLPPPKLTAKNSPGEAKSWVLGRNQALNVAMPEAVSTLHCAATWASGSSPPSLFSGLGQFGFVSLAWDNLGLLFGHTQQKISYWSSLPLHPQVLISCPTLFLIAVVTNYHSQWLKMTQTYFLTILEAESPKVEVSAGLNSFQRPEGKIHVLAFPTSEGHLHSLAGGPLLHLRGQQHNTSKSLSLSLSLSHTHTHTHNHSPLLPLSYLPFWLGPPAPSLTRTLVITWGPST